MNHFLIFFSKYYKYLIFTFIILFLAGVSYFYFENLNKSQIKKDGLNYINFILKKSENQNQEIGQEEYSTLEMIENRKSNFGLLAKLSVAQNFIEKLDFVNAKKKISEILEKKSNNKIIADYALFLYLQILISKAEYVEFDKIFDKKKFLLLEKNHFVFKENVLELAMISYIEQNKIEELRNLIDKIQKNEEKFSTTCLERIRQLEISRKYNKKLYLN
jgi:hypothetical protein